jgi:hypothetical protein
LPWTGERQAGRYGRSRLQQFALWRYELADFCHRIESRVDRAFGIVLMRLRIPKESQDFVRRHGGDRSAHSGDCFGGCVLEILGNLDQVFGVQVDGESHCAYELAR